MAKQDLELVLACLVALKAFDPANYDPAVGLTGAADISGLGYDELERGQQLMDSMSEEDIQTALASVEADIASASVRS